MYCNRCGNKVKPGSRFCGNCGFKINVEPGGYSRNPQASSAMVARKSSALIIVGIIAAVITIAAVIALIFIFPKAAGPTGAATEDSASFSTQMLSGFVFDDIGIIEATEETVSEPNVTGLSPASGTVGTKIQISGSSLTGTGLQAVKLGETELNLYSVSDEMIEVYLPYGAQSANISLVYTNQTINAGAFEVLPQQKQLLEEQTVSPSADAQTVSTGEISLTLPGGVLDADQTVRIEKIAEVNPINLPESVTGTAFSVTVGDIHQFGDTLTVDFTLPSDLPGEPSAAYFNEANSMWYTLPSEVVDGKLKIYTDHLTDLFIFYWGKAIYSSDGYFKIYYEEDDTFPKQIASSMDEFAQKIGAALEEARKDYEGEGASAGMPILPKAYREDFTYLGVKDAMDVYLQSNIDEPTYNATTNNILLNTELYTQEDLEITTAHELFHVYQDHVLSELPLGKMGYYPNKWAVEAIAELAAYELAYPEKNRVREVEFTSSSQDRYDTITALHEHEYDMACFLKYLLDKTNSNFVDMWVSAASNSKLSMSDSLNDFFKSKSDDFYGLELAYLDFWRDVVGDKDAPYMYNIPTLFDGRTIGLAYNQHTAEFEYKPEKAATAAFGVFTAKTFNENMPMRIFNVECTNKSASCTKITNVMNKGTDIAYMLNNVRVSGGHDWRSIYENHESIVSHRLYSLEQGKYDVVLIALEAVKEEETHSVKVSEIQAQCKLQKIDNVIPGQQQKFEVAFKDIFAYVQNVELVVDFGDGTVKRYTKANETGIFSGWITHTFGEDIARDAVTFSMYDVSGGGRELISQLVIPMTKGETVTLSASPNPAQPGDAVSLSTNISDAGYTYRWDFGDGQTATTYNKYTSHVYDAPGNYTATVTLLDLEDTKYGMAKQTVTIEPPVQTNAPPVSHTEPSATAKSEIPTGLNELELNISGTWRSIYFSPMYDNEHYYCSTLQFNSDGTFESRLSAVKIADYKTTNHALDVYHIESEIALDPNTEYVFGDHVSEFGYTSGTYTYNAINNIGEVAYTAQFLDMDGNMQTYTDTQIISFNLVMYSEYGIADPGLCSLIYKNNQYENSEWTHEENIEIAELYGTWELKSETFYDEYEDQYWSSVEALQLNADGTCVHEINIVLVDAPENANCTMNFMESEQSSSGEYWLGYTSNEAVAAGKPEVYGLMKLYETGYSCDSSFWYDNGVVYFENELFIKK